MKHKFWVGLTLSLSLSLSLSLKASEPDVITQLKTEIDADRYEAAYALALQNLGKYIGKPEFDYLYGIAALRVREEQEAIFAFERVLIHDPFNGAAREALYKLRPEIRRLVSTWQSHYHLVGGIGADSNINDATDSNPFGSLPLPPPLVGFFTPPADGKEQSDNFARGIAAGNWQRGWGPNRALFMAANFEQQENLSNHTFDKNTYTLQGGLLFQRDTYVLRYPVTLDALYFDNKPFRFSGSIGVEYLPNNIWTRKYPFSYFVNGGGMRFHRRSDKDVDFVNGGVRWYYQTPLPVVKVVTDVYLGTNHDRHHRGRHNGNQYGGLRGRVAWDITARQNILLAFGYQQDDYDSDHPIFRKERKDLIYTGSLGWEWWFKPKLAWGARFSYKRNDSNLGLFDHKRNVIETGMHYQF